MKKNGEYVGVDEKFIPENEKYVDESLLGDKDKAKKTANKFAVGYLCLFFIIFAFVIGMMIFGIIMAKKEYDKFGSKSSVEYMFEQYQGTNWGSSVQSILDKVVTNNKTSKKIITVAYKDKIVTTEEEIVEIKRQLVPTMDYEVSIDYDDSGKVNKITIKDIK